jgi:hypothetical protein
VIGFSLAALMGVELSVLLGVPAGLAISGVLVIGVVITLGRLATRLTVDAAGLHAGPAHLPPSAIGRVAALTPAEARELAGPRADARAWLLLRGGIPTAVQVEVTDDDPTPYWLISTRHPQALAAAVATVRDAAVGPVGG